jgi:hypothetical protein
MIFDRILNTYQQSSGALKPGAVGNAVAQSNAGALCNVGAQSNFGAQSNGVTQTSQTADTGRVEITNIWSGPILILSDDSQIELEKHYLNYSSTIPAESFEAIFRGRTPDQT